MDSKLCIKCQQWLPLSNFYREARVKSGVTARCKVCMKSDALDSYQTHKEQILQKHKVAYCPVKERAKKLRLAYGLSFDDYETMLATQNHSCLICGSTDPHHNSEKFVVDHCHLTNKVRGLLCSHCNLGLGNFKDNPQSLKMAADYLERFADA
jgi:hypothetical protein